MYGFARSRRAMEESTKRGTTCSVPVIAIQCSIRNCGAELTGRSILTFAQGCLASHSWLDAGKCKWNGRSIIRWQHRLKREAPNLYGIPALLDFLLKLLCRAHQFCKPSQSVQ